MDPDAIFIMLLWLTLLILTIGAAIGLLKKIWLSKLALFPKILLTPLVVLPIVYGVLSFNTVQAGPVIISVFQVIIYSASFLIALNWSINISKKLARRKKPIQPAVSILVLLFFFTFLIPFAFFQLGHFFDKLNLLGSGG